MIKSFSAIFCIVFSASLFGTEKWGIHELAYTGPKVSNPFADTQLSAEFQFKNRTYFVEGFYDGNRIYKIRFMPDEAGTWTFRTRSNQPSLDGKEGEFVVTEATEGNRGPVRVADTFHFAYADGTPFHVLGTTAYAWVHQDEGLIEQTLDTLKRHRFNKVRMTVMPKQYADFIQNEPPYYPYEGSKEEDWDFSRFNVAFFQHFEAQVEALRQRGVEADVILFHPYDWGKWGLNEGSVEDNKRYLRYLIARLAAYRNVWWSMANEYDIMRKPDEEWETYFRTIMTYDPYRHLRSIHNGKAWYDHSQPWITHLSVQTPFLDEVQDWRELYSKPVINDEFVYEGNIPHDWGNLTPEETVNRFWIMYCRGGYASHGETYMHPNNILWWSKGGVLHGESPARLDFFHEVMEQTPRNLIPFHDEWNKKTFLYSEDQRFILHYYGNSQQAAALLKLPDALDYRIEVIDAWNMTIDPLEGNFSGETTIPLPQRPYMAVRAQAVE